MHLIARTGTGSTLHSSSPSQVWTDRYEMSQSEIGMNYFLTGDVIFICLFLAQYEKAQILH